MMMRGILLALMLAALPLSAEANSQQVLFQFVPCNVRVNLEPKEQMLHVRLEDPVGCGTTPEDLERILRQSLEQNASSDIKLIFLGRIKNYPWIVDKIATLASKDRVWNGGTGHARDGSDNVYLGRLLGVGRPVANSSSFEKGDLLWPIRSLLREHGYDVIGASVEKVFSAEHAYREGREAGLYPVDALVHLRIAKVR